MGIRWRTYPVHFSYGFSTFLYALKNVSIPLHEIIQLPPENSEQQKPRVQQSMCLLSCVSEIFPSPLPSSLLLSSFGWELFEDRFLWSYACKQSTNIYVEKHTDTNIFWRYLQNWRGESLWSTVKYRQQQQQQFRFMLHYKSEWSQWLFCVYVMYKCFKCTKPSLFGIFCHYTDISVCSFWSNERMNECACAWYIIKRSPQNSLKRKRWLVKVETLQRKGDKRSWKLNVFSTNSSVLYLLCSLATIRWLSSLCDLYVRLYIFVPVVVQEQKRHWY